MAAKVIPFRRRAYALPVPLAEAYLSAGTHAFVLDAHDLSSGVYVYRVQAESYVEAKRLTVLK